MPTPQDRARTTYNTASDLYDHPANAYWERYGSRTVKRIRLAEGASVLDVASGTGASAIPAAELVGPSGRVVAVDLAEEMQAVSRRKAAAVGISNVEHITADMTTIDFPPASFDAVVCVFGVFFAPDIPSFVDSLWKLVRPGGQLAVTTWGSRLFEPMYTQFDEMLREHRPDLVSDYRPWDLLTQPHALEHLLTLPGATVSVQAEPGRQQLTEPEDWWRIVLGSGLRSAVIAMGNTLARDIERESTAYVRANQVNEVETNVIYGAAQRI